MIHRLTKCNRKRVKNCKKQSSPLRFGNYASLIYYIAFINRFMGFLPYKLESSKFMYSKLHSVFSTIVIIIYLFLAIISLYEINFYIYDGIPRLLHRNSIALFGPAVFICSYISNRSTVQAIQRVQHVSYALSAEIFNKLIKIFLIKDILFFMPLGLLVPFLIINHEFCVFLFICWYSFFGLLIISTLYLNNVYILNACFKFINNSLIKIKKILINDEPHLLRREYHMKKNPILLMELRILKKQYTELIEAVQLLNHSYSLKNEMILLMLFFDITFNLYIYLILYNTEVGKITKINSTLGFAIFYVVYIVISVSIIEIIRVQMKKIGSNIHKILVHTFDDQIITEVRLFDLHYIDFNGFIDLIILVGVIFFRSVAKR